MTTLGTVHLFFSFIAIGAGGIVVAIGKGTRWHRTVGHVYATAMIGVIVTAFSIYGLTGSFGPFHFAAIVSGIAIFMGLTTVLLRRPRKGWMESHAIWMSWSYIGLIAAFFAESLSRFVMPRVESMLEAYELWYAFWTTVGVTSVAVCVLGAILLKKRLPGALASTPEAIRREEQAQREAVGTASATPAPPVRSLDLT